MRRAFGVLVTLTVISGIVVGLSRVPEALAEVELFRVSEVRVEGTRYLSDEEAVISTAVPAGASVWDDLEPLAANLRAHPLVHDVRVGRRLPGTLVLHVIERTPVALLPTPALVPVDGEGRLLPIDPALHRLDLPLIRPDRGRTSAAELTPAEVRAVAEEIARLTAAAPDFMTEVSEVGYGPGGDIRVRLGDPETEILFRPPLTPRRLLEGLAVLRDAGERRPESNVEAIDLRYEDQVVVRFSPSGRE